MSDRQLANSAREIAIDVVVRAIIVALRHDLRTRYIVANIKATALSVVASQEVKITAMTGNSDLADAVHAQIEALFALTPTEREAD